MPNTSDPADPFLWLEDVLGDKPLDWVRARNAESQKALTDSDRFQKMQARTLSILDSTDKIAYVAKRGEHYYNLWQDADNPRGLWRRTTLERYRSDDPQWETVLDLDALGKAEGENWVWKGSTWLVPDRDRCLLSLSRGGADATVVREFDIPSKSFVEDGFVIPEAKTNVAWKDRDTIYVGTDFGDGSMTESGYPRIAKQWRRGTELASDAKTIAEGKVEDIYAGVSRDQTEGFERDFLYRGMTFYTNELFLLKDGEQIKIDKPDSANASVHREWLLIELREDWLISGQEHAAGSLLVIDFDKFLAGDRTFDTLFAPTDRSSLAGWSGTRNHILVNVLDNVRNVVQVATHKDGKWQIEALPGLPEFGTISASPIDADHSDDYWLTITDYLTPTSLWMGSIGKGPATKLKSLPSFFDADGLVVEQREATSKDGTQIPYFLVMRESASRDGKNPTLLYGYGGFEVSLTPSYSATVGANWLEQGGVFVVANIRGGGEFGPRWHQAALKQNRNKCYEDFAAVAQPPDRFADHVAAPPRHPGRQQRRPADGQHDDDVSGPVPIGRLPGAAARHAALPQAARGCVVGRRVRRSRQPGRSRMAAPLLALPQRQQGHDLPEGPVHDVDARRPRAPRPRAQDDGTHARAGPRRALLREHRGRPRRRGGQQAGRVHVGAGLRVLVGDAAGIGRVRSPWRGDPVDRDISLTTPAGGPATLLPSPAPATSPVRC